MNFDHVQLYIYIFKVLIVLKCFKMLMYVILFYFCFLLMTYAFIPLFYFCHLQHDLDADGTYLYTSYTL